MLERLTEFILPRIIGVMVHKRETLSQKAHRAQESFVAKLDIKKRKTEEPVVLAILGLVGSGKSSVAQELAKHLGATVIEGDAIRVELRKQAEAYKYVRQIAEDATLEVIKRGGNVVLDSDHTDDKKRASLREKVRKAGVRFVFVRTYADPDVMLGRMLAASYRKSPDDFFGGAKTTWREGNEQQTGAVIKIKEAWRRTPHHYRWVNEGGGKWVLKKFPFAVFAEIDTTDSDSWKREVEKCAKRLLTR